jgi:hypothetical protein
VKGVSLLAQNSTYFNKSKPASHKCRTVKYVLTRSSEFQNNRRKISREQKFQERQIKSESTEDPFKQTSAQNDLPYKQKMSSHAHKLRQHKNSKSSSETDFRKKKRIKKLI